MARTEASRQDPALDVRGLNVRFGTAHVLQDVDLRLASGVLSLVGRNGMGKTTLCRAVVGLVPFQGSISTFGQMLEGRDAASVARCGVGYVPQGRRLWPSLTVEEHLDLVQGTRRRNEGRRWTAERIYERFPGLHARRRSEAAKLSGGEQQMLAIARALLREPALLVMDEPTEGLAPVIVQQVVNLIRDLAATEGMNVLLIEQNLGVALDVSDRIVVLTNGRLNESVSSAEVRADADRQRELLGFTRALPQNA